MIDSATDRDRVLIVTDQYENGDPASPTGCVAEFWRNGSCVCLVNFPNEDNEDIQYQIELAAEILHFKVVRRSDVDNDYGFHMGFKA